MTSNICTGCWPGTSGSCKQDNGVCWDYVGTDCPGGTTECPPVTVGSPTTPQPTVATTTPPPTTPQQAPTPTLQPTPQATTPQPTVVGGASPGSPGTTTPAPTVVVNPTTPTLAPDGNTTTTASDDDDDDDDEYWTTDNQVLIDMISQLSYVQYRIDNELLLYKTPQNVLQPSNVYKYNDMIQSLMVMSIDGVAGNTFFVGPTADSTTTTRTTQPVDSHIYGLVNLAAFLAQSMKETIQYDACDENSWDVVNSVYPLSNACGQLNQSYQDYECPADEKHMECPLDPTMEIMAVTNAKWYGAPGPLFCRPKSNDSDFTGKWNHNYQCNNAWKDPPETCDDYEGQLAGQYDNSSPIPNRSGRTDVENCCWWGRGVIQTTGRCNFGKLNYFLGARAAQDGRTSRYPDIDFCQDPEAICSSVEYKELKWVAGMFYWIESVQRYNSDDGWNYMTEIVNFVDGGMTDDSFIDAVSGIVNRGCHNPPCGTGPVDGGPERRDNFRKALDVFTNVAGSIPPSPLPPKPGQGGDYDSTSNMYPYPAPIGGTTNGVGGGYGVGGATTTNEPDLTESGVKATTLANPLKGMGVGIAICIGFLIASFGIVSYRRRKFAERTRNNIRNNIIMSNNAAKQDDDEEKNSDMWSPTEEELGLEEGSGGGSRSSDVEEGGEEEDQQEERSKISSLSGGGSSRSSSHQSERKESGSQVHGAIAPRRKISSSSHQQDEKQEVVGIVAPRRLRSKLREEYS